MVEDSVFTKVIKSWWESFPPRSRSRGNIAGGLLLLENLRDNFDLDINAHKAPGSDQLRNATRANVQKILARFDEERVLLKEGGRTITTEQLSFEYRKDLSSRKVVGMILESARNRRKAGEVAAHLVGAKLALRFPDYDITNATARHTDDQENANGDFQINDCVFHVTVAPNSGHYDRCNNNLDKGLRVFLLVPDEILDGTRQSAKEETSGRVSVEAIESFVSQSIEELSDFAGDKVSQNMRSLFETYNERTSNLESDLSLQLAIPTALENS